MYVSTSTGRFIVEIPVVGNKITVIVIIVRQNTYLVLVLYYAHLYLLCIMCKYIILYYVDIGIHIYYIINQ